MNRKERRRQGKKAKKVKNTAAIMPVQDPMQVSDNYLFSHAMGRSNIVEVPSFNQDLSEVSDLLASGLNEKAIKLGQALIIKYPDNIEVQLVLGIAHFGKESWVKANEYLEIVLSHSSNNLEALLYLGEIAIIQNK